MFGYEQASRYLDGLETHLSSLVLHPGHYPAIRHIREGYRRSVYGVHAIYYSELEEWGLDCSYFAVKIPELGTRQPASH